ncbi:hypothetical protein [Streptomyces sp. MB09-02B]|uniref:hypothetical protein n=1 Tax=Streptomyces sp. MB09-02B TaxID=3028667 RepID=UPI0029B1132F|nr:hypothetical protein [Streptomyces sp. MB09-02B]MDX3646280.1 hypothetical protein [Streptomyces sp. MB09-02B]
MATRAGAARKGALVLAAIVPVMVSVGSCGSEPRGSAPGTDSASAGCEIRDTTQQVADRFSGLGEVVTTEWCAMDLVGGSSRVPGPSDIRMVGYFETTAEDMKAVLDAPGRTFEKAEPEGIPAALGGSTSGKTEWLTSTEANEEITAGLYTGTFYFDRASNKILFDAVNPTRADDEGAVVGLTASKRILLEARSK